MTSLVKRVFVIVSAVIVTGAVAVAAMAVDRSGDDDRSDEENVAQLVPFAGGALEAVSIRTASGWLPCRATTVRLGTVLPILAWRRFRPLEELAAYGLDRPALEVKLEQRQRGRLVIHLGASNADNTGVYSRQVPGKYVYLIDPEVAATIERAVADC